MRTRRNLVSTMLLAEETVTQEKKNKRSSVKLMLQCESCKYLKLYQPHPMPNFLKLVVVLPPSVSINDNHKDLVFGREADQPS